MSGTICLAVDKLADFAYTKDADVKWSKKNPFRCDTQNCTCGTCKPYLQLKMFFNLCVSSREGGKVSIGRHEWAHGPTDLGWFNWNISDQKTNSKLSTRISRLKINVLNACDEIQEQTLKWRSNEMDRPIHRKLR